MPQLRPYRPGDEQGIRDLFEVCHGRPLSRDLWSWRYSAQGGRPPVIDVAEESGRIVAHLGALPVALRRGGESLPAGLWVDLMVHPDFRNLSLFLDMAETSHRRCAAAGARLVFAFPNDRSYPVLKRMLGWSPVEELDALEAPLADLRDGAAGFVEPLSGFGEEHERLGRRLAPADAFAAERAAARLNWRYRSRPDRTYPAWQARGADGALRGWLAANVFEGPQGKVGDILELWAEADAQNALWSAALAHFRELGVRTVSAWALKDDPLFARYAAWGLAPRGPRAHFAARWTSADEKAPLPSRGRDWRVSKGDSDVF